MTTARTARIARTVPRFVMVLATCLGLLLAQVARGDGTTVAARRAPAGGVQVEADLSLTGAAGGLSANGSIRIRQPMVQAMIERALRGTNALVDPIVSHESANDVYVISGNLEVGLPIVIRIRLDTDGSRLRLTFLEVEGLGPNAWYEERVIQGFAYALRSQGVRCDDVASERKIVIGLNDFMHGAGLLPKMADLDEPSTRLSLLRNNAGDLTFELLSANQGPRITPTAASDIAVHFDPEGVRALLSRLLEPDYHVKGISMVGGRIDVTGEARWRALESASSGITLLAALLGDRTSLNAGFESGQAFLPIALSFRVEGGRIYMSTSHEKATDALERALTDRGIAHTKEKSSIVLVWRDIIGQKLGRLTGLTVTERGSRFPVN